MGVYMSQPCREKVSDDQDGKTLSFGASSMQGWRKTQEDAHNCCLDYENGMSLFAVYDGHGGAEVAQYAALHFPNFLKNIPAYKEGRVSQALEDAFLAFDEELIKPKILEELNELAGVDKETEEERQDEVKGLFEEADMPIEQLLQRYQAGGMKSLKEMRKGEVNPSPALRAKKSVDNASGDNEDIKENLAEKLVNGEGDCNGEHKVSDNSGGKEAENSEVTGKGDNDIGKRDSNGAEADIIKNNESPNSEQTGSVKAEKSECDADQGDNKSSDKPGCTVNECSEAAASGPTDSKSDLTDDKKEVKPTETLPDSSTQQQQQSGSISGQSSPGKAKPPKTEGQEAEAEVSSSSEQRATSQKAGGSSSASSISSSSSSSSSADTNNSTEVTGSSSSSSGQSGSSSDGQTSAGCGSSSGGSSSSCSADSSSKAEPSSSSGRTRSGRKNIIPEEGEDESSFDEEEETTDEDSDDDDDVEMCVEDDSEDDCEDETELEGLIDNGDGEEDEEDRVYSMEPGFDSGCTAVVALVKGRELFVSNAGDSRCVVCRDGKAVDMSFDHKPEDEVELKRILEAGGQVTPDGRVNGGLNLSRAIGDHAYKKNTSLPLKDQMISALPDVRCMALEDKDEFMVLACDGIWNSLSSQETVTFIKDRLAEGVEKLSTICEELFECCLAPNTNGDGSGCDNMTCIIVKFKEDLWKLPTSKRRASAEVDSSETEAKKAKEGD